MKVTFVKHSSYFVELEKSCLLFDYYDGEIPETDKPIYVFASHSHGDHFSEKVFSAPHPEENYYILSRDIFKSRVPEGLTERTIFVKHREKYEIGDVKFETLKSTDAGVAYIVECEGKVIYHAGDLNCWVWDGALPFQNNEMVRAYTGELEALSGRKLDAAFVPLDPRQEDDFYLGMKYFFETVYLTGGSAEHVFPMHMWGDHSVIPLFRSAPGCEQYAKHLMRVESEGEVFEF